MNLYLLSGLVLIIGLILTALVFISYRKRLAQISPASTLNIDLVKTTFQSTSIERLVGYAFVAAIGYLILQTIRQGFDFALLMIGAIFFTGLVWLLDRLLTQQDRQAILQRSENELDGFDEQTDKSTLEPGLIENSRSFLPILVFVFVLRSFLIEPFQIPSGSMKPTLEIRDFILVNRFTYGIRMPITNNVIIPISQPEQGDVIVFKPPHDPDKSFIKRVIAVPGDTVAYDYAKRELTVNGQLISKTFIEKTSDEAGRYNLYRENLAGHEHLIYQDQGNPSRPPYEWLPYNGVLVPEGKYFVMGDNRDNSQDARYWEGIRRLQTGDMSNSQQNAWGFVDEDAILGEAFAIWMHWEGFYPTFSRAGKIQ